MCGQLTDVALFAFLDYLAHESSRLKDNEASSCTVKTTALGIAFVPG